MRGSREKMSDDNWRAVPETLLFIARFEFRIFGRKRVIKRTPFEEGSLRGGFSSEREKVYIFEEGYGCNGFNVRFFFLSLSSMYGVTYLSVSFFSHLVSREQVRGSVHQS